MICKKCGNKCDKNSKSQLCRKCFCEERRGKNAHNYKGGLPHCKVCGAKLKKYTAVYCIYCFNKSRRKYVQKYCLVCNKELVNKKATYCSEHWIRTKECKNNMSKASLNKPKSKEHIENIRKNKIEFYKNGGKPWIKSKTKETNDIVKTMADKISKISILKGLQKGEKNPNFRGWISRLPYSMEWSYELIEKIRNRDDNTCQNCLNEGRHVHHIDYNKKNCKDNNLITLCNSCHSKSNFNREYWKEFFIDKLFMNNIKQNIGVEDEILCEVF